MGLLQELSALIEQWLLKRRNATLPLLSRLSGVSYPTVRRIHQRESEPTLNNVVSILSIVATGDEARGLLQKYYPELAQIIGPTLDRASLDEALELDHFTPDHFLILTLASIEAGVSIEEIKDRSGKRGLDVLFELEGLGAVERLRDRFVTREKALKIVSSDRVLESISHLCQLFDRQRIDSRGSLYRIKTEGLSRDAVLKVYAILYEASEAIQKVIDDPLNRGEYVLGVGMVSTFLRFPEEGASL